MVEELSGQVEVEATKHSPISEHSSGVKDGEAADANGKLTTVRVVGMDEGSGNRKEWLARQFRIGSGPPRTAYSLEEVASSVGRLMLDEGKSRYVASPFWASISDEVGEIKDMLDDRKSALGSLFRPIPECVRSKCALNACLRSMSLDQVLSVHMYS